MEKQVFQFTNYEVPVEIAGHQFTMDCSVDTGDYIKEVSNKLRELAASVSAGEKNSEDIVNYGSEVIDHLLGEGSAALVLSDRKSKTSDVMDLCTFLVEVAAKFRSEHQKSQMNRAQRRAAAKK